MTQDINDNINPENNQDSKENEINLLELAARLWEKRKVILVWCMWGVIAGLIIAFSIPKEYTTTVKLAPETKPTGISGSLGALASWAGFSSGNNTPDAVYLELYPDVVSSVPFLTGLFDVPVKDKDGNVYVIKDFLKDKTKSPWWGFVMSLPGKAIGLVKGKKESVGKDHVLDNFHLTFEEDGLVKALAARISASVDKKTDVITIQTQMQDPVVSAILADTVVARLRAYITDYRTNKARKDLEYALMLNSEAQQEYYKAQQRLADYTDRNQNLATRSAQVTRDRLENEADLAFNLYNETSMQVQGAKSRVQETTPVYTVIDPASVPISPSAPRKGLILAGFTFLAFVASCAWILFGSPMVKEYKAKVKELKQPKGETPDKEADDDKED